MSEQQTSADQRLAEAMTSFGRDVAPTDEGWEDVVSGRVLGAPRGRPGQRFVVGVAAALLVVALAVAGATLRSDGEDGPPRATVPPSDPAPLPTTTVPPRTIPVDPNGFTQECLDGLGVEYRMIPGDGGPGFGPPASATDEQNEAFAEGIDECWERLWPEPSPEEQAENVADGERYTEDLIACLVAAGFEDTEAVPAGRGAWDIVPSDGDQGSPEFQSALNQCTELADSNAEARRADADGA